MEYMKNYAIYVNGSLIYTYIFSIMFLIKPRLLIGYNLENLLQSP